MSETAQGSVRGGPPEPSSWEDLLDPAVLKARLQEARTRREQALAQRAATGEGTTAASRNRADRIRTLDMALAGKPQSVPGPVRDLREEPRTLPAREAPAASPTPRLSGGARAAPESAEAQQVGTVRRELRRPELRHVETARSVETAPGAATMPERLATVIVRPTPTAPAEPAPPELGTVAEGGRRLAWPALLLGLLVGAACMVLAVWWGLPGRQAPVAGTEAGLRPAVAPSAPDVVARLTIPDTRSAVPADPALVMEPLDTKSEAPPDAGRETVVLARGPAPGPLGSLQGAAAGAAEAIASGTALGAAPPRLRFASADPEAGMAGGRGGLAFADGPVAAALTDYPVEVPADAAEDKAPAAPVKPRKVRVAPPAPHPVAAETPAPEQPAPVQTAGARSTLQHAVESLLRNHLLGR